MRRRLSLRARATILGTLVFALLLGAGSLLLVSTLEDRLVAASDRVARARVQDLLDLASTGDLPQRLRPADDDAVAQVVAVDGEVIAATPNVTGRGAIADLPGGADPQVSTFEAPDDDETESYRVWHATGPGPEGPVTAYVGSSLESVAEATGALRRALWAGIPLVVLLLGGVTWLLLGRTLARLDRIRAEVDRITATSLDSRVAGDGVEDEVGRLAATMNAMLSRLDDAARRQRDFVADVSHDLQSPLAAQRVVLEVGLADPHHTEVEALAAAALDSTGAMERLVADLLVLAQVDAGVGAAPALVDLDAIVLEEALRARVRIPVDSSGVSAAPAHVNPDDLRRIVRNLLDNAAAYAATGISLVVDVDPDGRARLDVVDDGPGIPEGERDRIFDRFHRGDTSRAHDGGSGLGLAIARSLAERAGGELILVRGAGGAHLRLLLPGTDA